MTRLHRIVLLGIASLLFIGQARAEDEVKYFDRTAKKEASLKGTIKSETPSHIEIKLATATKEIPAVDIIDVVYQVPAGIAPDFRKAENRVNASQTLPNADDR